MKQQICQRMKVIAAKEGLDVDNAAIEMLVESVGNDIRQVGQHEPTSLGHAPRRHAEAIGGLVQVLNSMQMWKKTSARMTYADMKQRMASIEKDKSLR